jgi:hypothetical protein
VIVGGFAAGTGGTVTQNVSWTDRPLASVAATLRVRLSMPAGKVPEKVFVAVLKLSQEGNVSPFDWPAA